MVFRQLEINFLENILNVSWFDFVVIIWFVVMSGKGGTINNNKQYPELIRKEMIPPRILYYFLSDILFLKIVKITHC